MFSSTAKSRRTSLEELLTTYGGTFFTNCITSGPDTPRSTGILFSSKLPKESGLSSRSQWPGPHFGREGDTLFSWALANGAVLKVVDPSLDHAGLFFPQEVQALADFFPDLESIKPTFQGGDCDTLEIIFVVSNSYHDEVDKKSGHKSAHETGSERIAQELKDVVDTFSLGSGDFLFLYSDHGCKLSNDSYDAISLLNRDRSQVVFYQTAFNSAEIEFTDSLYSVVDLATIISTKLKSLIVKRELSKVHVASLPRPRQFVHVEDHEAYSTKIGDSVTRWAVFSSEFEYFEVLGKDPVVNFLVQGKSMGLAEATTTAQDFLRKYATNYASFNQQLESLTKGFSALPEVQRQAWETQNSNQPNLKKYGKVTELFWRMRTAPVSLLRRLVIQKGLVLKGKSLVPKTGSGQKIIT